MTACVALVVDIVAAQKRRTRQHAASPKCRRHANMRRQHLNLSGDEEHGTRCHVATHTQSAESLHCVHARRALLSHAAKSSGPEEVSQCCTG
eukprot:6405260-Amphidinium_carterae.3